MKWYESRKGQASGVIIVLAFLLVLGGIGTVGFLQKSQNQQNQQQTNSPPTAQNPQSTPGVLADNLNPKSSQQQGTIVGFTTPVPTSTPFPTSIPPTPTNTPTPTTPPIPGQNPGGGGTTTVPVPEPTLPDYANCTQDSQEENTATGCNGNLNGNHFKETFTVSPESPRSVMNAYPRWFAQPALQGVFGWDFASQPMDAQHNMMCAAPPTSRPITAFSDTVFMCKDHIMTAVSPPDGGTSSGIVTLKPNHLVDLSQGEATIRIDVSTSSPSAGDWWEIWFTPWEDQLVSPTDHWYHHAGPPKNAIQLEVSDFPVDNSKRWAHQVYHNYQMQIPEFSNDGSTIAFWMGPDFRSRVPVSDTRRDTYEVRMTQNHMKLLIKSPQTGGNYSLVDEFDIPGGFGSNAAVVQFQQSNYEPRKGRKIGCTVDNCPDFTTPNTWHWDNAEIFPAIPYKIVGVNEFQIVNGRNPHTLTFKEAAPLGARMLFNGQSVNNTFNLTFNTGESRAASAVRPHNGLATGGGLSHDPDFLTYTVDVPVGATSATIDGIDFCSPNACGSIIGVYGVWEAQNFHIIAR
ncbi:hypothetical protein HYS00_05740 [Candidatus Microgenomates bacterium]|nr:hypothetical protein [Candidatus Microgenomates bacterium]